MDSFFKVLFYNKEKAGGGLIKTDHGYAAIIAVGYLKEVIIVVMHQSLSGRGRFWLTPANHNAANVIVY